MEASSLLNPICIQRRPQSMLESLFWYQGEVLRMIFKIIECEGMRRYRWSLQVKLIF